MLRSCSLKRPSLSCVWLRIQPWPQPIESSTNRSYCHAPKYKFNIMVDINFIPAGQFKGVTNGTDILTNPTSLQFGPDGRLYVSEQNGTINAFTVALEGDEYVVSAVEEINLVKSIQNHNDDGSINAQGERQVTGIVATGTEANPVLYVSSSDPRIAFNGEVGIDTNSGIITRLSWDGTDWQAVDIIRGLPRSEENHATNGMVLSPDGTKLYVAQGGNTNNGAPSSFFSYTAEYALSGTVLEVDLNDINARPILEDPVGGQGGVPRQYIYDLPTLDDISVANDGLREDANGLDTAGPWGGNDGLNMSVLPADAPLRIYASGFRNNYDLVISESGQLYTVDNGSNGGLGGNPIVDANGNATSQPNQGGSGNPEPLFLIEDGGYYGHPNPALSNQSQSWTVYDDNGNPDAAISPNTVPNIADRVPDALNIQDGFLVDPSKFTDDPLRLAENGDRIEYNDPNSPSIVNLGSSSNGLVEYTNDAFSGALQGALIVTQFNGNITVLNLDDAGTGLAPLVASGEDGVLGTADDITVDSDGVYPLIGGFGQALDVTLGPDGSLWVAEIGGNFIKTFVPSDLVLPEDPDFDNDGIDNIFDPFIRDETNGGSVLVFPGLTLQWDFDADQDNNLPGPDGYGGGLTGVMLDGTTNYEAFFQEPSTLPDQDVKLDNVKFITAAGGGTTVIENVSNGTSDGGSNNGEYLFHTGVTVSPTVDNFTVKWSIFNPASSLVGDAQQVGGYIGTGDQSNYLRIAVNQNPNGEVQISLEDNDVNQSNNFLQVDDLFTVANPDSKKIFLELTVDPTAETATPTVTYETDAGNVTVDGEAISLSGTTVLDTIQGNYAVQGQESGLAVGLFSTNNGQPPENTFQAIFDGIEITAEGDASTAVLYRVNAGGQEIEATDGGPNWLADTAASNSSFLAVPGSNNTAAFSVLPGATVMPNTPEGIFLTERWDDPAAPEMQWAFDTPVAGQYEVRLFLGNGFGGTAAPGERIFDVQVEGAVPAAFDNIDLSAQFGHLVGGMLSQTVDVTDGTLNLEFDHGTENPLINGIEIIQLGSEPEVAPTVSVASEAVTIGEGAGLAQILLTTDIPVPVNETVNVSVEIVPLTATPGEDYEYSAGTFIPETGVYSGIVSIPGGASEASLNVDILQDEIEDINETFAVNITGISSNAQIGAVSTTVTIEDDDAAPAPTVSIVSGDTTVGEGDGQVQISLATDTIVPDDETVTVSFEIVPGSATAGEDYEYLDGTFDEATGVYTGTVSIPGSFAIAAFNIDILPDTLEETDEAFTVNITGVSSNAQIGTSTAEITIENDDAVLPGTVIYRVNAGGEEIEVTDGGPNWSADTIANNSTFLAVAGSNNTASFPVSPGSTIDDSVPDDIFLSERWDDGAVPEMQWAFDTPTAGQYEVRLYMGNGYGPTAGQGTRLFDINIEGNTPAPLDNIDLSAQFGHLVGGVISQVVEVDDGTLNIEFGHEVENPLINGIEIVQLSDGPPIAPTVSIASAATVSESDGSAEILLSTDIPVPNDETVNVSFEIVPGSATPGEDYALANGTLDLATGIYSGIVTVLSGASETTFDVDILSDSLPEADEAFSINIVGTSDNAQIGNSTTTITIEDDDETVPPTVSIVSGDTTVGEGDGQVQISLATDTVVPSDETVNVSFEIVPGSATAGEDYEYLDGALDPATGIYSGTVSIAGSSGDVTFDIDILQDTLEETDEAFTVNITGVSSNAQIGTSTAEITIENDDAVLPGTVIYRVNAGGEEIEVTDGGPNWSADTIANNSTFLAVAGSNNTASFPVSPDSTIDDSVPDDIFLSERWDDDAVPEMQWAFDTPTAGQYEVRLYMGNGYGPTAGQGTRLFDINIEGNTPAPLDNIDLSAQFGHLVGGVISQVVEVNDGTLNIEFGHEVENPLINGIEIVQLGEVAPAPIAASAASAAPASSASSASSVNNAAASPTVALLLSGEEEDSADSSDFFEVDRFDFLGEDPLAIGSVDSAVDSTRDDLSVGAIAQSRYLQQAEPASFLTADTAVIEAAGFATELASNNSLTEQSPQIALGSRAINQAVSETFEMGSAPVATELQQLVGAKA